MKLMFGVLFATVVVLIVADTLGENTSTAQDRIAAEAARYDLKTNCTVRQRQSNHAL